MTLFKELDAMLAEGSTLSITVAKKNDNLVVTVLPGNSLVKDAAKNSIIPLTISGLPDELDAGFLDAIRKPVSSATGLLKNLADFERAESRAKEKSQMQAKQKAEADKRKADFDGYIKLCQANLDGHKFKDATTCLESARPFADTDAQKKQLASLEATIHEKSGVDTIFGAAEDKSDGKNVRLKPSKDSKPSKPSCDEDNDNDNDE